MKSFAFDETGYEQERRLARKASVLQERITALEQHIAALEARLAELEALVQEVATWATR